MLLADATNTLGTFQGAVHESFSKFTDQVWGLAAPSVLAMIFVLVVGYIVARLVARVFTALGEKLGLQVAAERSGLAESMRHVGIQRCASIIGTIVFWLLICVFGIAAFTILGLPTLSAAMNTLVKFIPSLLVATVVVVVGLLVASFLRGIVATSADRLGVTYAEHLASGCYYALAVLTSSRRPAIGNHFELLNYAILILFGGLALAFGLSFGLGGREVMAGILAGYYLRQRLTPATTSKWPAWKARSAKSVPWPPSWKPTKRASSTGIGAQHQDAQRGGALNWLMKTPPPRGGSCRPGISNDLGAISLVPSPQGLGPWGKGNRHLAPSAFRPPPSAFALFYPQGLDAAGRGDHQRAACRRSRPWPVRTGPRHS